MVKTLQKPGGFRPSHVAMEPEKPKEGGGDSPRAEELDYVTAKLGDGNWELLEIVRGSIIEVPLSSTSEVFPEGVVARFLVLQVSMTVDRTVIAEVRSLGCGDAATDAAFISRFNRKHGRLHICVSKPCTHGELENILHISALTVWTCHWGDCPVLTSVQRRAVRRYLSGAEEEEEDPPGDGGVGPGGKGKPKRKPSGTKRPRGGVPSRPLKRPSAVLVPRGDGKEGKEKVKKDRRGATIEGEDIPEESKRRLKESLASLKRRLTGTHGAAEEDFPDPIEDGSDASPVPVDSSSERDALVTGTSMKKADSQEKKKKRKKKEKPREKVRDKRKSGRDRTSAAMLALEDSNAGMLRGAQSQLARQALVVSTEQRCERKSKGDKASVELARILTKSLRRSGKKRKKEKKDKRKKSKKKKRGGGSSSPSSSSGEMSSSSRSSSGSQEDKESDSEDELEPPLKRKARSRPGSVLAMLVEHAKEQLDQSSLVGVPDGQEPKVTQGVKLASYFQILLKAKMAGAMPQQREMHHLSICMDLLRQGKLSAVGDALAARFLCLHQSVLDGNWTAARHMELYPLEESSAAGASIILKTRKHAKLALKAQGYEVGGYGKGYGRGAKGRGKYDYVNPEGGEKGKKGKAAKGKGRGPGKGPWWKDGQGKGDEWKEKQDNKPEQ